MCCRNILPCAARCLFLPYKLLIWLDRHFPLRGQGGFLQLQAGWVSVRWVLNGRRGTVGAVGALLFAFFAAFAVVAAFACFTDVLTAAFYWRFAAVLPPPHNILTSNPTSTSSPSLHHYSFFTYTLLTSYNVAFYHVIDHPRVHDRNRKTTTYQDLRKGNLKHCVIPGRWSSSFNSTFLSVKA